MADGRSVRISEERKEWNSSSQEEFGAPQEKRMDVVQAAKVGEGGVGRGDRESRKGRYAKSEEDLGQIS